MSSSTAVGTEHNGEVEFRTLNKAMQHVKSNRVGKGERESEMREIERESEQVRGREIQTVRERQTDRHKEKEKD